MKTENSIYIKCNNPLLSNKSLLAILLACTAIYGASFVLNFYHLIGQISAYSIFFICSLFAVISLYRLTKEPPHHYIFINEDEISFKQNKQEEAICLRFEGIDYFETRFSQIIFSTKQHEKVILQLNRISNEKKRWEIKEFLRGRVKQANTSLAVA